jgi:hypothetical protein
MQTEYKLPASANVVWESAKIGKKVLDVCRDDRCPSSVDFAQ